MERRRRQSKRKEVEGGGLGMDSTVKVEGAGRLKLKQYFNCVDKCCSHDVVLEGVDSHDVVLKQVVDCMTRWIRTERSTQPPSCKVATGLSAPVVLPPLDDDGDNNHKNLDRQHISNNDKCNKFDEHKTAQNAIETPPDPIGASLPVASTPDIASSLSHDLTYRQCRRLSSKRRR